MKIKNFIFWTILIFSCVVVISLSIFIFVFLIKESTPFIHEHTLSLKTEWMPSENLYGYGALLIGSFFTAILGTLVAAPIGISFAAIITFHPKKIIRDGLRIAIDSAAGFPSVVVGLWGLVFVVPKIAEYTNSGTSLLAATIILAFMVTPILTNFFSETLTDIKLKFWPTAAASGLSEPAFLLRLAFPIGKSRFYSGFTLSMGRALGETMAVLFVCGNIVQIPHSLFDPIRTINTNIALELAYAAGVHRSSLFFGASLLMIAVSIILILSSFFKKRGQVG